LGREIFWIYYGNDIFKRLYLTSAALKKNFEIRSTIATITDEGLVKGEMRYKGQTGSIAFALNKKNGGAIIFDEMYKGVSNGTCPLNMGDDLATSAFIRANTANGLIWSWLTAYPYKNSKIPL
jgi:hypothetical protein